MLWRYTFDYLGIITCSFGWCIKITNKLFWECTLHTFIIYLHEHTNYFERKFFVGDRGYLDYFQDMLISISTLWEKILQKRV